MGFRLRIELDNPLRMFELSHPSAALGRLFTYLQQAKRAVCPNEAEYLPRLRLRVFGGFVFPNLVSWHLPPHYSFAPLLRLTITKGPVVIFSCRRHSVGREPAGDTVLIVTPRVLQQSNKRLSVL